MEDPDKVLWKLAQVFSGYNDKTENPLRPLCSSLPDAEQEPNKGRFPINFFVIKVETICDQVNLNNDGDLWES